MDDVDTAMAEIEKYQYTDDDGLIQWLKDHYDRMDYDEIINRLSAE
jgi:3-dehydroquinate synthetase